MPTKQKKRPERTARRRPTGASTAAKRSPIMESLRIDRGQRMLEVGSHMISYYMFLSHQLLPLAGEPQAPADPVNSPNRFANQFNEVRRCLLRVVGHHPVLRGKIERLAEDTTRMLTDATRYPAGHPTRQNLQQEAKALSQRLRDNSRAMSDLVAVLRNV